MLIIKLTDSKETLDDIETICRHITEHKDLINLLPADEDSDISYILKPTFKADHDERQKRAHWHKLLNEFTITDHNGAELRFYREKRTEALYFGSKEGFELLTSMNNKKG